MQVRNHLLHVVKYLLDATAITLAAMKLEVEQSAQQQLCSLPTVLGLNGRQRRIDAFFAQTLARLIVSGEPQ